MTREEQVQYIYEKLMENPEFRKAFVGAITDAANEVVKGIKALQQEPKTKTEWIPVSERLPEWHWETEGGEKFWVGKRVIACVKEADEYYDLVGVATYGPYGWESSDEGFGSCYSPQPVIAWMPLPEPYKASPTGEEANT